MHRDAERIVGDAFHHIHWGNLLFCTRPYETNTSCALCAVGYRSVRVVCWRMKYLSARGSHTNMYQDSVKFPSRCTARQSVFDMFSNNAQLLTSLCQVNHTRTPTAECFRGKQLDKKLKCTWWHAALLYRPRQQRAIGARKVVQILSRMQLDLMGSTPFHAIYKVSLWTRIIKQKFHSCVRTCERTCTSLRQHGKHIKPLCTSFSWTIVQTAWQEHQMCLNVQAL